MQQDGASDAVLLLNPTKVGRSSPLTHPRDDPNVRQPLLDDIEAWNQLFARGLNAWSRQDVDSFTATTTRLAVACRQLLPDAVTPLILLKEMILRCFRVAAGRVPGPAPTTEELTSQLALVAGHLDLLREVVTAAPPETAVANDIGATVDNIDAIILWTLAEKALRHLTRRQIETASKPKVTRKTIAKRLPGLLRAGLVLRPRGARHGHALAPAGRDLLRRLDAPRLERIERKH
jgi:hypothetical protein